MKTLVLASNNAGKIKELEALLGTHYRIIPQGAFNIAEVEETGLSFVENALLKARHAARHSALPALADDSGLCVEALQGAPGIHSARYSGGGDAANNEKLLRAMAGVTHRSACFVSVLAYVRHAEDPMPLLATGIWRGEIAEAARGEGGFGYDPIFYVPELGCSAAELSREQKNQLSHRQAALKQLMQLWAQQGLKSPS